MKSSTAACWLAIAVVAVSAHAALAGVVVIDNFQSGLTNLDVYDGFDSDSTIQTMLAGVLGGERRVEANYTNGSDDVRLRINRNGSQKMVFAEDPGTSGTAVLDYGYTNDLNADLLSSGDAFRFRFLWADLEGTLNITVTSSTGSSTASLATPSNLFSGSSDVLAYFSSFVSTSGSGADFTDVDKIHVELVGTDGGDYTLSEMAVPEPATLTLLVAGTVLPLLRRKVPRICR